MNPHIENLDSATLAHRLHELAGDERRVQVDFLLHLDAFDRRQAYLPLGFGSLWDYCLRALHLREGAAGRRIGTMRVLRRFPRLEAPLRDGRVCLSTVPLLGQVLTEESLDDLVARAAFRTKAEVEELVVAIRARPAPRDGVRKLAAPTQSRAGAGAVALELPRASSNAPAARAVDASPGLDAPVPPTPPRDGGAAASAPADVGTSAANPTSDPRPRAEVEAVARDRWSLRVTLDGALKEDLETLRMLLSHQLPAGDLREVLREAVRCGIDKHGKRRGLVAPARTMPGRGVEAATSADPRAVPADVRREVWARDGGRCTFVSDDGRRCDNRWKLELDHVVPAALGGPPIPSNLRLRCRGHNLLHATEVFGRERMDRFRHDVAAPRAPLG